MAIPRGNCPRDDARLTSAVVACFGAKENQIACITRSFRSPFKGIPLKACGQNIVTGHPAMPKFTFHPREIDALLTYIDSLTPSREPRVPKR